MASTVADIMNPKLLYIREGDRLSLARGQIVRFGVTAVPILDESHRPVGLVSLRDLASDHDCVAAGPVVTVRSDATVEEAARDLARRNVHNLVVVDGDGIAVGMVSALDVVRALVGTPSCHPPQFAHF
jgi:CBS domain-containing protein